MNRRNAEIRAQLRHVDTLAEKLDVLKGSHRGERCYLLSCGPSLGTIPREELRARLKDELVIAVKQAYDVVWGIVDFHLLNSISFKRYKYVEAKPIVIYERPPKGDAIVWGSKPDLTFTVEGHNPSWFREQRLANRLAVRQNYDEYLFERKLGRPWGPGVILELGIYLAVHMEVAELVVIGWDLGPPDVSIYDHFYSDSPKWSQGRLGRFLRRVTRRRVFLPLQFARHIMGQVYNKGTVECDDTLVSVASSYGVYEWLLSKGVRLSLMSDRSYLDARIPRVKWPPVHR